MHRPHPHATARTVADLYARCLGERGDQLRRQDAAGYLISPVTLAANTIACIHQRRARKDEDVVAFIRRHGGDDALLDALEVLVAMASKMAWRQFEGRNAGVSRAKASASLLVGVDMVFDEVRVDDEAPFTISGEHHDIQLYGDVSEWRHRLCDAVSELRTQDLERQLEAEEFRRDCITAEERELYEEIDEAFGDGPDDPVEVPDLRPIPAGLTPAQIHHEDRPPYNWISIDLGDARFRDGMLRVRGPYLPHAPDAAISFMAKRIWSLLGNIGGPGNALDALMAKETREAGMAIAAGETGMTLLGTRAIVVALGTDDVMPRELNTEHDVLITNDFFTQDTLVVERIWKTPDADGIPRIIASLVCHQRRIREAMVRTGGRLSVDPVLARIVATTGTGGALARVVRETGHTPRTRAKAIGLPAVVGKVIGRKGLVSARISLGPNAHWSSGKATFKGVSVPESVMMALPGQPIERIVEHPLLAGATIATAKTTAAGLVVTLDLQPVPLDELTAVRRR